MLKSFVSTLVSLISLSFVVPASAQVGPGNSSIVQRPSGYGYARVCTNNPQGRLTLRTNPAQYGPKIREIPNGRAVALHDWYYSQDQSGVWWYASYNGSTGFVREDYICGDPSPWTR